MNQTLVSIFVFGLLLLFIFSPFAALAGLMLFLLLAALLSFMASISKALIRNDNNQ